MQQFLSRQIVIVAAPGMRWLASVLAERLNRLQHPVWKRERDAIVGTRLQQDVAAIQLASVVVVIDTVWFRCSKRGQHLMDAANDRRADIISIEEPTPGRVFTWSTNIHLVLPSTLGRTEVDALTLEVSERIRWLEGRVSQGIRAPVGGHGRYVFVSYTRQNDDIARRVREQLDRDRIGRWDYGDSPRAPSDYQPEIDKAIRRCHLMVVLLTPAWLQSPDCRHEASLAAALKKRCLWLLCGDLEPPEPVQDRDRFDFRSDHQEPALQRLAAEIYPSRRRSAHRAKIAP